MTSGKVQLWEGKVLLVGGKVATHEDCCCGCSEDPCVDCGDSEGGGDWEQDNLYVAVAGSGGSECCACSAGTYGFDTFYEWTDEGVDYCAWEWIGPPLSDHTGWILGLIYDTVNETWHMMLWVWAEWAECDGAWFGDCDDPWYSGGWKDVTDLICCVTSTHKIKFKGPIELEGCTDGPPWEDCTPYTATVTREGDQ